jgi:formylglycine-generating enzyme required for sulfatase activity
MRLAAVASLLALCAGASAGDPAYYVRRGTWQETMQASREALAAQEAAEARKAEQAGPGEPGKPVPTGQLELEPFYQIGPFKEEGKCSFDVPFAPETEIDLTKSYGSLRWQQVHDPDGAVYEIKCPTDVAVYFYRKIVAPRPMELTTYYGSDDGLAVWCNGKKVISNKVDRPPAPNQDEARLSLVKGDNHLLIKIWNNAGYGGYYFSLTREAVPAYGVKPGSRTLAREALWDLVRRDFPSPADRREMAWERQDNIWWAEWPADHPAELARRYVESSRGVPAGSRIAALAPNARTVADLAAIRRLYRQAKLEHETLAGIRDLNFRALRLAVEDLAATFGQEYPKGRQYLSRLDAMEKAVQEAVAGEGPAEVRLAAARQFVELRHEALLANPLLSFDRLLLVKRKDGRTQQPPPQLSVPFINDFIGVLNGLPANFQGNSVLREVPFDNEIAVLSPVRPEGALTTVYRPEKAVFVGDVDLHYDADRLLFSSIGSHGCWQVFEVGVDGRDLRQVTRGQHSDVDNYDACYLPDGRIIFSSSAVFQAVPCERRLDETANLFVMNRDGFGVRRLCFDQDHDFNPVVMNDGRVLYLRWEYTDIAHAFSGRLFTMNPDGTGQRACYASSSFWPNRVFYPRPLPDRPAGIAGIVSGHHGTGRAGELVVFDVAKGQRQAQGVVQRIPGRDKEVEAKMVDGLVDGSWPKFLYPYPLSEKYFIVSCQPTAQSRWGIYLVDVFDNMLLLREEEGFVLFEPIPLRRTARPKVIPDRVGLDCREGTVYLTDIYAGEGLKGVPRGTVRKLRLFTYHYNYYGTSALHDLVGMDGPWDVRRILGTVPVAEDGSAYFTVPANTPIALQPLDAEGKALQLMRSWFTAMPGESLSCVGCHEDTSNMPPNRQTLAMAGEPSRIAPWYGPARGFSWDREVQPVLDRYCVGCHDGRPRSDGKDLADLRRAEPRAVGKSAYPFPPAYYALRQFVRSPGLEGDPRVVPVADYHADSNRLVQMLIKGHHNVRLDEEAWDRVVTWIDLNAPAYGTWMEMPSVRGRAEVAKCRLRRMESQSRYAGIDADPEAVQPAPPPVTAVMPPPQQEPRQGVLQVADWPMTPEKARQRQYLAGKQTQMEVDLGQGLAMQFVLIPAGEFVMGDQAGHPDERPLSMVKIERPFWMGRFEVTNEQYGRFDAAHDSGAEPTMGLKWSLGDFPPLNQPRQPVCRVSWHEAAAFCRWLSARTGKVFALPTEAQWEWACRAGTDTAMSFGPLGADQKVYANLADASLLGLCRMELVGPFLPSDPADDRAAVSATVGSYQPNAWGLHDMHGNVAEWTASAYVPYPFVAADPRHAALDARRVVRGGSWSDQAKCARSGYRLSYHPWQRIFNVGFRVVCEGG